MPYNDTSFFGGQGWIRTIEDRVGRFTVRCIWPLCNLPKTRKIFTLKNLSKKWSWRKESNLQPADYKSAALPLSHTSKNENLALLRQSPSSHESSHKMLQHFRLVRNNEKTSASVLLLLKIKQERTETQFFHGALRWNRTTDTRIFSPLLYRLSYQGINGDSNGARTHDLQRDRLAF